MVKFCPGWLLILESSAIYLLDIARYLRIKQWTPGISGGIDVQRHKDGRLGSFKDVLFWKYHNQWNNDRKKHHENDDDERDEQTFESSGPSASCFFGRGHCFKTL
jgi:hypothetical protein